MRRRTSASAPGELSDSPHKLTGAVGELADRLRDWRVRFGLS